MVRSWHYVGNGHMLIRNASDVNLLFIHIVECRGRRILPPGAFARRAASISLKCEARPRDRRTGPANAGHPLTSKKNTSEDTAGTQRLRPRLTLDCRKPAIDYRQFPHPAFLRASNWRHVFASSSVNSFGFGKARLYSRASTLLDNPSSAYWASASFGSEQRIKPTGVFSPSRIQCFLA